ncbi:hypothetical protein [Sulfobacillus sp. hq2]|uniref:hypothetical protein n=1 Tax=Sulfobacillus TaxID=28033 RepID=UPI000CD2A82E|nr:hypothetical protein [Sulfobacillus sp. hq2]POB10234.1 hypothetical protein CO251_09740 [Sulfobacillus sp. hq2]
MPSPTVLRFSAALGMAGSLLIGFSHVTMAASDVGTLTITSQGASQLKATWTIPQGTSLPPGTLTLYGWPNQTTPGSYTSNYVIKTQNGSLMPDVTTQPGTPLPSQPPTQLSLFFPAPHGWPNIHETFQMTYSSNAQGPAANSPVVSYNSLPFSQLPEVPWAAALPLLMVSPWLFYAVRKRRVVRP